MVNIWITTLGYSQELPYLNEHFRVLDDTVLFECALRARR
jgi:hypothetical protein